MRYIEANPLNYRRMNYSDYDTTQHFARDLKSDWDPRGVMTLDKCHSEHSPLAFPIGTDIEIGDLVNISSESQIVPATDPRPAYAPAGDGVKFVGKRWARVTSRGHNSVVLSTGERANVLWITWEEITAATTH